MNRKSVENPEANAETLGWRQAAAEANPLLRNVLQELRTVLRDENLREETPIEVWMRLESAVETIAAVVCRLGAVCPPRQPQPGHGTDRPTIRQGQFLAYINEYMTRNATGLAPTHAVLQRFFRLTPPSVNSMLIRLEQRGFIRRIPGVARGIELLIDPKLIPPLDQPFRF
jgi:repressor LexA